MKTIEKANKLFLKKKRLQKLELDKLNANLPLGNLKEEIRSLNSEINFILKTIL